MAPGPSAPRPGRHRHRHPRVALLADPGRRAPKQSTARWQPITADFATEPGEAPVDAARRELKEETGLADAVLSREVWPGRHRVSSWGGTMYEIRNHYFLARVEGFAVDTSGFEEQEIAGHLGAHWWTPAELAEATHLLRPRGLPSLLTGLLAGDGPDFPLLHRRLIDRPAAFTRSASAHLRSYIYVLKLMS